MSNQFMDLPVELISIVGNFLPHWDLVHLSSTCSLFREIFIPWVFPAVRITNTAEGAETVHSIFQKYGKSVKEFHFICKFHVTHRFSQYLGVEVRGYQRTSDSIPESILNLLGNTEQLLPKLEKICITVAPSSYENWNWLFWSSRLENSDEIEAYNTLTHQVYNAISLNDKIKCVAIKELLPVRSPTWQTKFFHSFLKRLETFELSIWGGHNGAGSKTNTNDRYWEACGHLGDDFFQHLHSAVSLRFESSEYGPFGENDPYHLPLPLMGSYSPNCRNLELVHCFIGTKLQNFINSHAKVLKTLVLRNCYVQMSGNNAWEDFFESISATQPVLSVLVIENNSIPLTRAEEFNRSDQSGETKEIKRIREMLKDTPLRRRLFSYAYTDDEYGTLYYDEDKNVVRFQDGGDQRAYDKLRKTVESNASRRS